MNILLSMVVLAVVVSQPTAKQQPKPQSHDASGQQMPAPSTQSPAQAQPSSDPEQSATDSEANKWCSRLVPPLIETWPLVAVALPAIFVGWRTLKAMRESSERQLRAYVLPDNAGIVDGTLLTPPQPARANIPGAGMNIKNFGQTPAYKVVSWAQIAVIAVVDEGRLLVVPPMPDAFSNTLGPGGLFNKFLWFDRPLAANEIADIATGMRAVYFYGRIEYRDAFEKARFTNFRLQYIGPFPPGHNAIFNFSEKGNEAN
jgi:hypothetical protein